MTDELTPKWFFPLARDIPPDMASALVGGDWDAALHRVCLAALNRLGADCDPAARATEMILRAAAGSQVGRSEWNALEDLATVATEAALSAQNERDVLANRTVIWVVRAATQATPTSAREMAMWAARASES